MQILTFEQGTPEWLESRKGKITGTRAKSVMAKNNTPMLDEMLAEMLCTVDDPRFVTSHMERGTELESEARQVYESITGNLVDEVGFCISETEGIALSPDGLISVDGKYKGGLEIKCPSNSVHARYLRTKKLPAEYKWQVMQYFVVVDEMEWLDFVSYNPNFSQGSVVTVRISREYYLEDIQALYEAEVKFLEKLKKEYIKII